MDPVIVGKLAERARRFEEIERMVSQPEIASDPRRFPALLRERGQLERAYELNREVLALTADGTEARSMVESGDQELAELGREELERIEARRPALEREIKRELVKDEELARTRVIVEVRAGTGGDEATLFARDLFEIYTRYAELRRWRIEPIEATTSDVGGFKEMIFALDGPDVWNRMRFESGGHRVQRVPATESQGRTHTSAATVAVLPEAEDVDIEIRDEDLRIDTMRAGGPGGQSVNTTSSAVRITHLPTNTVVQCQDEKSQLKNKAKAMRVLRARLYDAEQQRLHAERADQRKSQVGSGDRSQRVRTYNYPQNRCTDHRLSDNHSLEGITAGKLDPVIDALIEVDLAERIRAL
ncbi:Peptide chain release factor RF1 [Planctomycetes bacterium Pla163]|uniref:Peptide chain release factor 1 n=1 Tax=Rohdeia mirabilis TaxID=2528008 RepID=A0A518D140_9BACT|nr:Peptide chain release factor RF1 [Planctomycetes bacterium Pla163]